MMENVSLDDHNAQPWGCKQEMESCTHACAQDTVRAVPKQELIGYNKAFYLANLPARVCIWHT